MWPVWILLTLVIIKIYNKLSAGKCYSKTIMTGRVVIVTGANSGIGYQTAKELAKRGAKVILACRDEAKGIKSVNSIRKYAQSSIIRHEYLDLSSLASIREFVDNFKRNEAKLDVLINNAGASGMCRSRTADGMIRDMQVNHFGPFLLTLLLVPLLKKSSPSRIINVSSALHRFGTIERLNENCYNYLQTFCNSKLCNVLFTNELARRLKGSGVEVNCLHPGQVNTALYRNSVLEKLRCMVFYSFFKSPKDGAQTSIYLAVSDECDGISGSYFVDCAEGGASEKADDPILAEKLWDMSAELVKLRPDEAI